MPSMRNVGSGVTFGPTGSVIPLQELEAMRKKKGQCIKCGETCFKRKHFKMIPLDVPGVVENGRCLKCEARSSSGSTISAPSMTASNRSTGPPLSTNSPTSNSSLSTPSHASNMAPRNHSTPSPSSTSTVSASIPTKGAANGSFPASTLKPKGADLFPANRTSVTKSLNSSTFDGQSQKSKQSPSNQIGDDDGGSRVSSILTPSAELADGRVQPRSAGGVMDKYKFMQEPWFFVPMLLMSIASLTSSSLDAGTSHLSVVVLALFGFFAILWNGKLDRKSDAARERSSDRNIVFRLIGEAQTISYLKNAYKHSGFDQALGRLENLFRNKNRHEKELIAKAWALRMRNAKKIELDDDYSLNLDRSLCLEWIKQLCKCADVTNTSKEGRTIDRIDLFGVRKEIERIMSVCLVMDRANALYAMQYDQSSKTDYGMHWISALHAEQDPTWRKIVPPHSKFPMNRKYVLLLSMKELGLSRRGGKLTEIGEWLQPKRRDDSDL